MQRSNRARKRGGRTSVRLPAQLRHNMDVTYSGYRPPMDPPVRQLSQRVRFVVSSGADVTVSTASNVSTSIFFTLNSNLKGFQNVYIHRVSVWTNKAPANFTALVVHPYTPGGTLGHPSFRDTAGLDVGRACIGYHVPSHLSGIYTPDQTFIQVLSSVDTIWVEIDATFC